MSDASRPVPSFERSDSLRRLRETQFDVLVVGGGITGAGVALDAASRGFTTALVDRGDFASGTSSKSSKMVHGGLRYLEQREIRLVYDNLAERQRLLRNAPHLVTPLPFLIPLFGRGGVVAKTVARTYSVALWLYDLTGGLRIGKRHRRVSKAEAIAHLPLLDAERLVAGFLYYDARADDARLTLAVLRTAALQHGAVAANYAVVEGLLTDADGRVGGARIRPAAPGGAGSSSDPTETIDVRARVVVNATGVWADDVRALDEGTHPRSLRPAKGVHVTVPRHRLPADLSAVIPVRKDRRSVFVVPWPDTELVYVGTTDTDHDGPLDDATPLPEDVDYLLDAVNAVTTARLTRADVTATWAGLRPLVAPGGAQRISVRTADLSRRHTVRVSARGLVTVTGGKLTTYRRMAADTVDAVARMLGSEARCVTAALPLLGAPPRRPGGTGRFGGASGTGGTGGGSASSASHASGASPALREHLRSRYGTEAAAVLALADDRPALLHPIVDGLPYVGAEVVHAVRHEMALTIEDVLARRTRIEVMDARAGAAVAGAVAELCAAELGWLPAEAAAAAARYSQGVSARLEAAGLPAATGADRSR